MQVTYAADFREWYAVLLKFRCADPYYPMIKLKKKLSFKQSSSNYAFFYFLFGSDFLNDFFKPITAETDRMKSLKKHKHGRRIKQLEKFELKMKEERQKRIRERQKEFFGELEVHKYVTFFLAPLFSFIFGKKLGFEDDMCWLITKKYRERLDDVFKFKRERLKVFNKYAKEYHKRKERIHREKIDRIQREKINLLKINDVEGYLRMVQVCPPVPRLTRDSYVTLVLVSLNFCVCYRMPNLIVSSNFSKRQRNIFKS